MACRQLRGHPSTPVTNDFIVHLGHLITFSIQTRTQHIFLKITTASKINLSNTKSRGLTWVLEVGGRHRLLDFIAQKIQGQVGRLQLQGGDEQIQDMDLGFVSDFRNLLLLVRV